MLGGQLGNQEIVVVSSQVAILGIKCISIGCIRCGTITGNYKISKFFKHTKYLLQINVILFNPLEYLMITYI